MGGLGYAPGTLALWFALKRAAYSTLTEKLAQGSNVILEIDWQGARQIKEQLPFVTSIFILPPSVEALEQRLNQRGQDSQEVIAKRMQQAKSEISHVTEYDYVLVNDDFQLCLQQLQHVVLSQRLTQQKQQQHQQALLTELLAN